MFDPEQTVLIFCLRYIFLCFRDVVRRDGPLFRFIVQCPKFLLFLTSTVLHIFHLPPLQMFQVIYNLTLSSCLSVSNLSRMSKILALSTISFMLL